MQAKQTCIMNYYYYFMNLFSISGEKGRKDLIVGSLPTEFLPVKSIETPKPLPRIHLKREFTNTQPTIFKYYNFQDLKKDLHKIKTTWFITTQTECSVVIVCIKDHGQIHLKVSVDESLKFSTKQALFNYP